jgi:hypothetical protein
MNESTALLSSMNLHQSSASNAKDFAITVVDPSTRSQLEAYIDRLKALSVVSKPVLTTAPRPAQPKPAPPKAQYRAPAATRRTAVPPRAPQKERPPHSSKQPLTSLAKPLEWTVGVFDARHQCTSTQVTLCVKRAIPNGRSTRMRITKRSTATIVEKDTKRLTQSHCA